MSKKMRELWSGSTSKSSRSEVLGWRKTPHPDHRLEPVSFLTIAVIEERSI